MDEQKPLQDRGSGPQSGSVPTPHAGPVPGRRRLLTGGLSATGVVMTLASRPVWAATCQAPSAFASANTSNPGKNLLNSGAESITWWRNNTASWPLSLSTNKQFNQYFRSGTGQTFLEVLQDEGSTFRVSLRKHFVAAALNIEDNRVAGCLTKDDLLAMWAARSAMTYTPRGSTQAWNSTDMVLYLQQSGVVPAN